MTTTSIPTSHDERSEFVANHRPMERDANGVSYQRHGDTIVFSHHTTISCTTCGADADHTVDENGAWSTLCRGPEMHTAVSS